MLQFILISWAIAGCALIDIWLFQYVNRRKYFKQPMRIEVPIDRAIVLYNQASVSIPILMFILFLLRWFVDALGAAIEAFFIIKTAGDVGRIVFFTFGLIILVRLCLKRY